jgi:hypothetical protein
MLEKYCTAGQMTIWGTRIACWIPKATRAHSEYVIFFAVTVVAATCLNDTLIRTLPVLLNLSLNLVAQHINEFFGF